MKTGVPFPGEDGMNTELMKTTASPLSLQVSGAIRWNPSDLH